MKTSTRVILVGLVLGTVGAFSLGMYRSVYAKPLHRADAIAKHQINHQITQSGDQDGETNDEQAQEQQESAKLRSLAKISSQQAQQTAEASQGAKASSVNLENEDGNLVYTVAFGSKEVKVDAGNGRVLYIEAENESDNPKTEALRPRSSIQVTAADNSDGDGETNDDG